MNEISKVLDSGEHASWEGKPRYARYMFSSIFLIIIFSILAAFFLIALRSFLFVGVIFGLVFELPAALLFLYSHLSWRVKYYTITNKRTIFQFGIIGRDFKSVDFDKIQNVKVEVGLLDSLFNTGRVEIYSGQIGVGTSTVDSFQSVLNPYDVLKKLHESMSKNKEANVQVLKSIRGILEKK